MENQSSSILEPEVCPDELLIEQEVHVTLCDKPETCPLTQQINERIKNG